MKLEETLNRLDQTQNESLSRLSELLKFKSISTNSKYKPDCIETAKWLVAEKVIFFFTDIMMYNLLIQ